MHTYMRQYYATYGAAGAEISLLLTDTALNSPHPIQTAHLC